MCPTSCLRTLTAISALILESAIALADGGTVIYVDAHAAGATDGTSWVDAYTDLQDALPDAADLAADDVEIWVAAGTYHPDRGTLDSHATFRMLDGVGLYGGFTGIESTRAERDPTVHVTILSGDLLDNDGTNFDQADDNTLHVLTARQITHSAQLDGFTITGGRSADDGGGMLITQASPTIRNCVFERNAALDFGGAIANVDGGNPLLINCFFHDNLAYSGVALANIEHSDVIAVNCVFVGNRDSSFASGWGAGVYMTTSSRCTIINCLFSGNSAATGGALASEIASTLVVHNSTISHNYAAGAAGGVYVTTGSVLSITNSILWGNEDVDGGSADAQIALPLGDSSLEVRYSSVMGWPGGQGGVEVYSDDPLFKDIDGLDDTLGTYDDDLRLAATSPAINAGYSLLLPSDEGDVDDDHIVDEQLPFDADGRSRVVGRQLDIGAYEFFDCNTNGIDDDRDIETGTLHDVNGDGNPDECQCYSVKDCLDSDRCTIEECRSGVCLGHRIANCCTDQRDCVDASACTIAQCVAGNCEYVMIEECCMTSSQCPTPLACFERQCFTNACVYVPVPNCGTEDNEAAEVDSDDDGVSDDEDACRDTSAGDEVDQSGCSCAQLDEDLDGVDNCRDECAGTSGKLEVDNRGCPIDEEPGPEVDEDETLSAEELADDDGDDVANYRDECPETASDRRRDAWGCSCDQRDGDADGVTDCDDICPETESDVAVSRFGCSCGQLDADGDGVNDCLDQCPRTRIGQKVDDQGCVLEDLSPAISDPPATVVAPMVAPGVCGIMGLIPLAMMFTGLIVMRLVDISAPRARPGRP